MEQIIQKIMEELIKAGQIVQGVNKVVPIQGERYTLPLDGRDIDIAYYKAEEANRPLLIGLHGGGFVTGGSAIDNNLWCALRDRLNVNVASVNYRMAPDNKWPAAVLDTIDAAIYLKEHAEEYGFDKEQIFIQGSSAGGNIAATACIYAKQKGLELFKGQILFYPYLDFATDPIEKGGTGIYSGPALSAMNALYANEEDYGKSTLSPVCAKIEELKGLPPAIFCLAGEDTLCAEGAKYSGMLKEARVPVFDKTYEGMAHAFIENWYADQIPEMLLDELTKKTLEDDTMEASSIAALDFVFENFKNFK